MAVSPKQVKAFLLGSPDDRVGVNLNWLPNLELDLDHYNVYRGGSVILSGPIDPSINVTTGDTLILSVDGGASQTIVFDSLYITDGAATPSELVANLNAFLSGAEAAESQTAIIPAIFVRSLNHGKGGSIEILGGTAAPALGFPGGNFSNNPNITEFQQLGQVLIPDNFFLDLDGQPHDSYYVEAVTTAPLTSQPSVVKSLGRHLDEVPQKIFIYGKLFDAGGKPLVNERVMIRPAEDSRPSLNYASEIMSISSATMGIGMRDHTVFTDQDGYFEIPAIANSKLRLVIPAIEYDNQIQTSNQNQEFTKVEIHYPDRFYAE